jgi:seryl-tRNA synthetase
MSSTLSDRAIRNGVFFPNAKDSELERRLFNEFEEMLRNQGFHYLSVPSLITKETYDRQDVIPWEKVFRIDENFALAGSAEQGILELYTNSRVDSTQLLYAKNQCFRAEKGYEGWKRLREFIKLEQFVFTTKHSVDEYFDLLLTNATEFLDQHEIEHRVVDVTSRDPGYHIKKYDVEVLTKTYGWMETHSCSYFGTEQSRRFDITGIANHTISNTGIASPRILVPFLERE